MTCSHPAFDDVWEHFHLSPFEEVYVPVKALDELMACHEASFGHVFRQQLILKTPAPTARKVLVRRNQLWKFLQDHRRVHDEQETVRPKVQRRIQS